MLKGFGLKGNIVDKEGFPNADVEKVLAVRDARNKIASMCYTLLKLF